MEIFTSTHNHNNHKFNLVHIVCTINGSVKSIAYEIYGDFNNKFSGSTTFDNILQSPHIISFFGVKGETYFIKIKINSKNIQEKQIEKFYKFPDDYNINIPPSNINEPNININIQKTQTNNNDEIQTTNITNAEETETTFEQKTQIQPEIKTEVKTEVETEAEILDKYDPEDVDIEKLKHILQPPV